MWFSASLGSLTATIYMQQLQYTCTRNSYLINKTATIDIKQLPYT